MLEIIAGIGAGIIVGIFTGLIPGLHSNLLTIIILSLAQKIGIQGQQFWIAGLIALTTTHLFINILPSAFLGATNDENIMELLPLQRLVKKGKVLEGILAGILGTMAGLYGTMLIAPIIIWASALVYTKIQKIIPFILIGLLLLLLKKEPNKFKAGLIIFFSGLLGWLVFNKFTLEEPLLPLLTGLFGLSSLLIGIQNKETKIRMQKQIDTIKTEKKLWTRLGIQGIGIASCASLLPTISSSHAAFLVSLWTKVYQEVEWIFLSSIINASYLITSFLTFIALGKERSGMIAGIAKITNIDSTQLEWMLIAVIITSGIAAVWTWKLAKFAARKTKNKIPIKKITYCVILLMIFLTMTITGWKGLFVLVLAASIGITTALWRVGRSLEMAALIIPVIIYFLSSA
ncbi:tripartite tricarboxylate transporter permease [Candidatus Woesearchaeota archaeon]|nr:tripartite tricarboxylate transporter permease [Candidatus Woesearchaeota archaeon]